MGQVFRAVRVSDGEVVALKLIKAQLASDPVFTDRFRQEVRAAHEVTHNHLVSIVDSGEAEGRHYMAMNYVDGQTLRERLREGGPLALADLVRIIAEVGAGLNALHLRGMVHRDVKPANIMLDREGRASLTDFGLARGKDYTALTKPGQVVGTIEYLAPELIRGEPATPASDVYALGCVAFECIAGHPPFRGSSIFEVGMAILDQDPPDPCAERSGAPADLTPTVHIAMNKDPASRPQTATTFSNLLRAAAG